MNIFWLDKDPEMAVKAMYDIHLTKQILEIAQMLGNIVYENLRENPSNVIKSLHHAHHPVNVWIADSVENAALAVQFARAVKEEYTARTGEENSAVKYIDGALRYLRLTQTVSANTVAAPPIVMDQHPECYNPNWPHTWDSVVAAYRYLYVGPKYHLRDFRPKPEWYAEYRHAYITRSEDRTKLQIL